MANIVVTSDANTVIVDFGAYYPTNYPVSKAYYNRNDIQKVELFANNVTVHVLNGSKDWYLSYDGKADTFQVDSVDGVAPTSDSDLASKIAALIKA